jgi:predicted GNAT family acetyltransferase
MIFTVYNNAKDFTDDVLEILNRHEIQNNLLYKNIGDDKFMASVKDDDGNIILTAARTPSRPMTLYETDNVRNDDAAEFFAQSLVGYDIDVDCVITEKELAKSFCEKYSKLTNKTYHNNESLVLYVLEKVNTIKPISGSFRKASEADMFFLPYWLADFVPACNLGEYNLAGGIEGANKKIETGDAYLWVDEYPVSLASKTREVSDCAIIAQVYTPPNLRGKGYSTACVAALSQKLLDDGYKYCALYADCANPASNRVYQKIGYKEVFWYDQYKLIKGD